MEGTGPRHSGILVIEIVRACAPGRVQLRTARTSLHSSIVDRVSVCMCIGKLDEWVENDDRESRIANGRSGLDGRYDDDEMGVI